MNRTFWLKEKEYKLRLKETTENGMSVSVNGREYRVEVEYVGSDEFVLKIDGKVYDVIVSSNSSSYYVYLNGKCIPVEKKSALDLLGGKAGPTRRKDIKTSMPGRIIKVLVQPGDQIDAGQPVLILEAMKMQNEVKSPQSGTINRIGPSEGDSVEAGALLFTVE